MYAARISEKLCFMSTTVLKEIIKSEFTKSQKIKKKPANAYVCGFSFYFKENIKQYKTHEKKRIGNTI